MTGIWNLATNEDFHDFESVINDSLSTWELSLTNNANGALDILSVTTDSASFDVEFDNPVALDSEETVSLPVTFHPIESRDYSSTLKICTERRNVTVDLFGTGVPLSVIEDPSVLTEFVLLNAFPNPFNSTTRIRFTLPHSQFVSVKLFDFSGREVATLQQGNLSRGEHAMIWDATNFPTGIYFCKVETADDFLVNKLVLCK